MRLHVQLSLNFLSGNPTFLVGITKLTKPSPGGAFPGALKVFSRDEIEFCVGGLHAADHDFREFSRRNFTFSDPFSEPERVLFEEFVHVAVPSFEGRQA